MSYRQLIVWQKSMDLVILIYKLTEDFPVCERYGLTSQMRRAAVCIPSSIAEGRHRSTRKDFKQYLVISLASGAELDTQLEISKQLNYGKDVTRKQSWQLLDEVMRMLNTMIAKLKVPKLITTS